MIKDVRSLCSEADIVDAWQNDSKRLGGEYLQLRLPYLFPAKPLTAGFAFCFNRLLVYLEAPVGVRRVWLMNLEAAIEIIRPTTSPRQTSFSCIPKTKYY